MADIEATEKPNIEAILTPDMEVFQPADIKAT
jgi:hypothetical protein